MNTSTALEVGICELYRARATRTPGATLFQIWRDEAWQPISAAAFMAQAEALAAALRAIGLTPGMRLAILAVNGLDWERLQCAALLAGVTVVGIDPQETPARQAAMLTAAEVAGLAIDQPSRYTQLPASARVALQVVICSSDAHSPPGAPPWWTPQRLLALDLPPLEVLPAGEVEALVIFTSGSTGLPRAIAYRHAQLGRAVTGILAAFPQLRPGDRLLCWLPLANLFQRMINLCGMAAGACSWLLAEPRELLPRLQEIRPHWLVGVPRFYEKFYAGVQQQIAAQGWLRRRLGRWALATGAAYAAQIRAGRKPASGLRLRRALADALVLRRIRAQLGGALRAALSGSAPCPPRVLEGLHACGLLVLEAYGLSESILPVALNQLDDYEFGSVGRPLPGVELALAADGEILVRSPGVFTGYLHDASRAAALDEQGFLHTGDLGEWSAAGRLLMRGRKGEVFKTSTGRKVAPAPIEALLRELPGVAQAVVFGAGQKCVVALLTPAAEDAPALCVDSAFEAWARRAAAALPLVCIDLPAHALPGAVLCDRRPLTAGDELLTVNLKLRRPALAARYADALTQFYAALEADRPPPGCTRLTPDLLLCVL